MEDWEGRKGPILGSLPSLSHHCSDFTNPKGFIHSTHWRKWSIFLISPSLSNSPTFLFLAKKVQGLICPSAYGDWTWHLRAAGENDCWHIHLSGCVLFLFLAFRNHTVPFPLGNWFCLPSFSSNCSWTMWIVAVFHISYDSFLLVTS